MFQSTHYLCTYYTDTLSVLMRLLDSICHLLRNENLLTIHLVFAQILYIYWFEVTQTHMRGNGIGLHTTNLQTLQQILREVHAGRRCSHRTDILRKHRLITLLVHLHNRQIHKHFLVLLQGLLCHRASYILRQWRSTHAIEVLHKVIALVVRQETQGTTTRRRVINHFRKDSRILVKKEFITNTYLTRRINQHIPIAVLMLQLTQQEHLDICIRFLFLSIQTSREHLCVIRYNYIALIKARRKVTHTFMLYLSRLSVQHQQTCIITKTTGELRNQFLWKLEFEIT